LEITKNQRILRLLSEVYLNFRQRELTKFFKAYCLSSGESADEKAT
jgi:hypothetical protein